jgi:ferritin-like metal-binding protein YciE
MARDRQQEVIHFLSDLYSVEQQALVQMTDAPQLAGDEPLAEAFRTHEQETREHARLVGDRLEQLGGSTSALKDAVMKLGGRGFLLFARSLPETPGRLLSHACSYEAMEWAGYTMLVTMAEHAQDSQTAAVGRTIRGQEQAMRDRLAGRLGAVEALVHQGLDAEGVAPHVRKHLAEAHALERQSVKLLERSGEIARAPALEQVYHEQLDASTKHRAALEQRLDALGGSPSKIEDLALAIGGTNWSLFFQAQSDTPVKLAAFVYAFDHLRIAGYELLLRTARRAADADTEALVVQTLQTQRLVSDRLAGVFEESVLSTFDAVN